MKDLNVQALKFTCLPIGIANAYAQRPFFVLAESFAPPFDLAACRSRFNRSPASQKIASQKIM
jgi:hypothetical protein